MRPQTSSGDRYRRAVTTETLQVTGIRCERCVMRLGKVLEGHEGLEFANANLMGEVALGWDDERTSKDEIVAALARSGFPEIATERE